MMTSSEVEQPLGMQVLRSRRVVQRYDEADASSDDIVSYRYRYLPQAPYVSMSSIFSTFVKLSGVKSTDDFMT